MKRLFKSAAVIIATVGATLSTTAAQASAAPTAETVSAVSHENVTRQFADIPTPAVLYSRYSTLSQCISVGSKGEFHGRWLSWSCYDNRPLDVQLWVVYS
ncbi:MULTISPECIES: hypothetical protein [Streptomyces]|uniref:Ricin B lectin domain-containing protein n=1 Tax=Streptomyces lycii TaxID=2654337 RepID=A0ABQ7FJ88_9ACTN|nr:MULTISPECIES: hypothetical protein [Streptomyces]KAF4408434.1 hypothetical protein GCU69_14280 [Streptomyces lycii]PGH48110.1 hypothetical protein CRI70_24725 [Streptomyces sp. Ru87]